MDEEKNDSVEEAAPEAEITQEPSQDPIDQAIEREKAQTKNFTEAEKAAFNLRKNAERAKELGVDVEEVIGIRKETTTTDDGDVPEWFKKHQASQSRKTAVELAESIEDPKERELVKLYLKRVVPSEDPREDLRFARQAANATKNEQIMEEIGRKSTPGAFASGAGAPAAKKPVTPELTPQEQLFTRAPFNMTAAEIIAKRPQE